MTHSKRLAGLAIGLAAAWSASVCSGEMVIVREGQPVATIVVKKAPSVKGRRRRAPVATDAGAAATLVDWVRKMSGAELPVAEAAPAGTPTIYVGAAAVEAGLKLDDIRSASQEGLRVRCDGAGRLLLGGQSGVATVRAACRVLEKLGCRYFMDHPLGEVAPRRKTVAIGRLDIRERPGLLYRSIWGSR